MLTLLDRMLLNSAKLTLVEQNIADMFVHLLRQNELPKKLSKKEANLLKEIHGEHSPETLFQSALKILARSTAAIPEVFAVSFAQAGGMDVLLGALILDDSDDKTLVHVLASITSHPVPLSGSLDGCMHKLLNLSTSSEDQQCRLYAVRLLFNLTQSTSPSVFKFQHGSGYLDDLYDRLEQDAETLLQSSDNIDLPLAAVSLFIHVCKSDEQLRNGLRNNTKLMQRMCSLFKTFWQAVNTEAQDLNENTLEAQLLFLTYLSYLIGCFGKDARVARHLPSGNFECIITVLNNYAKAKEVLHHSQEAEGNGQGDFNALSSVRDIMDMLASLSLDQ